MQKSFESLQKSIHFMDRLRMASSRESFGSLEVGDLNSEADVSMESLSPITLQSKPVERFNKKSARQLQSLLKQAPFSFPNNKNNVDSIIAELDVGIAELTDQPFPVNTQSRKSASNNEGYLQRLNKSVSVSIDSTDEVEQILSSGQHQESNNVAMEFDDLEEVPLEKPSPADRLRQNMSQQLPVKHSCSKGTQHGMLLPKYHTRGESKCIRCKDCGIFFSPAVFLKHFHGKFGRREESDAQTLQLHMANPTSSQLKIWEDFQFKLRQTSPRKRSATFTDSLLSKYRRENVEPAKLIQSEEGGHNDVLHNTHLNSSVDDSVLGRQRFYQRERRPSAPGLLLQRTNNSEDTVNKRSSFLNRPVIMGSQPKNTTRSNKNILQKYLPLEIRDVSRMSSDSLKFKGQGQLRRANSLSNITNIGASGSLDQEDRGSIISLSDQQCVLQNNKEGEKKFKDPVYILQTAQELITLATSKIVRPQGNGDRNFNWEEKYEHEKQQRLKAEERVKNLERLLQEEIRMRETLESHVRALHTTITD